jgi:hypothetical protein
MHSSVWVCISIWTYSALPMLNLFTLVSHGLQQRKYAALYEQFTVLCHLKLTIQSNSNQKRNMIQFDKKTGSYISMRYVPGWITRLKLHKIVSLSAVSVYYIPQRNYYLVLWTLFSFLPVMKIQKNKISYTSL